jgi:hypothetical protein
MKTEFTTRTSKIKITDEIRKAYEERDRSLDTDPDAPTRLPEAWASGTIGKYYRARKTQISFRIGDEIPDWLKSKGEGHLECPTNATTSHDPWKWRQKA